MFAYINYQGKNLKIKEGQTITLDRLKEEEGAEISLSENISLVVKDDESLVLQPKGEVVLEVLEHYKGKKITIIKHKPKKCYRRKKGHRQHLTKVKVKKLTLI